MTSAAQFGVVPQPPQLVVVTYIESVIPVQIADAAVVAIGVVSQSRVNPPFVAILYKFNTNKNVLGAPVNVTVSP